MFESMRVQTKCLDPITVTLYIYTAPTLSEDSTEKRESEMLGLRNVMSAYKVTV